MGKTFRREKDFFDPEDRSSKQKKGKHSGHSNNRKSGGMRILNDTVELEYQEDFDDDVGIRDYITINKIRGRSR